MTDTVQVPVDGERSEYILPVGTGRNCRQCDPDDADRRVWRQMKSGQDTLRCFQCGQPLGNLAKRFSGLPQRSIKSRPEIDPALRAEILEKYGSRCLMCNRTPEDGVVMHVAHFLSIDDCKTNGVPEDAWNAEYNLCVLCEECNLSQGGRSWHPVHLIARLTIARRRWVNHPKYLKWLDSDDAK